MKYKIAFIIFFLISNFLFSQSKYFVKYKNHLSQNECEQNLSHKLNSNSAKKNIAQIFQSISKRFRTKSKILERMFTFEIPSEQENILSEFKDDPYVEYIQKASTYIIDSIPNDSLYAEQWGLQNINAENAWSYIPQNSEKIILAIIDTGIDNLHPDLKNQIFRNQGELGIDINGNDKAANGIDDDENGFVDDFSGWDFVNKINIYAAEINDDFTDWDNNPMDENGHGTNVAGIIGAEHNSIGIAGVIPKIQIMNLRAFDKNGNGEEDDAASAIIYAVSMGAKVINMSWGDSEFSQVLKDVIDYAYSNGVILVGSSGNSGSNLPHYPSSFSNVLSVGAIQSNETLASFSNYGSTIDLVAPGSQIITTNLNNTYKIISGTSASAPFVSAAISIILSYNHFNNEEIKQVIKTTCKDLGEAGWDEKYGAGNLDLEKALKLLLPSEIKINCPQNEFYTSDENIKINISCISPSFKSYNLQYGIGYNPTNWIEINIPNNQYQTLNENVYNFDLTNLLDTTYSIRLLVNTIDNKIFEERSSFTVDRTKPQILSYYFSPALLKDEETIQTSIQTDDKCTAQIFYRKKNSSEEFNSIYLDEFNSDIKITSRNHFGFIPINEIKADLNLEFYFVITNQAKLETILKDGENYFTSENSIEKIIRNYDKKKYSIPSGRIFPNKIKLTGLDNNFLFVNENSTSSDLSIYEINNSQFTKINFLKNRIPISVGNFNNDEKTDILSLYVKSGFIETQTSIDNFEFYNVFKDTSQTFWPALAEDIDKDSKTEIIVFSDEKTITIWEVQNDFSLIKETDLNIYNIEESNIPNSIFRNNQIIFGDFDNDSKNEIVTSDNFGRLLFYEIENNGNYKNDLILETFSNYESESQIAKGDFNGDGILDIAVLTNYEDNNFDIPISNISVFTYIENKFETIYQKVLIKTEENFTSSFDKSYSSLRFAEITGDEKDEIIISQNPNLYIFEFDSENSKMIFYKTNVNTQSIFVDDIDENGIKEIGIPQNDFINFFELNLITNLTSPNITDYYSIDSTKNYFVWQNNNSMSRIYKGSNFENIQLHDSTTNNFYIDSVNPNETYFYAIDFKNNSENLISNKSKIISIYSHAPGKFASVELKNKNSLEVFFTLPIDKNSIKLSNIFIENENPNSFTLSSEKSLLLITNSELQNGDYQFNFINIRDIYNTPFQDSTINFSVNLENLVEEKLFIQNYKIINNHKLNIIFNINLDTLTSLNLNNYIISPQNNIVQIQFEENTKNSIFIFAEKPFGSIGKEYILSIKDIFSSKESGYLPIKENSGSQIILTSNSENLNEIFVYPNPVNLSEVEEMTFANLTQFAEILIYSLDGKFVKKIVENDGNGGISWNLIDENNHKISSGIYIFKAISKDFEGENIQEKLGKFAVIR